MGMQQRWVTGMLASGLIVGVMSAGCAARETRQADGATSSDRQPENAKDLYERGSKALRKDEQPMEAVRWLKEAVRLDPTNAGYHHTLGDAWMESGQERLALEQYGLVLKLGKPTPPLYNAMGWANLGHDDAQAVAWFDEAIKLESGYANAWYGKAEALHTLGRLDEARHAIDRAMTLDPASETYRKLQTKLKQSAR